MNLTGTEEHGYEIISQKTLAFADSMQKKSPAYYHYWGRVYPESGNYHLLVTIPADAVITTLVTFDQSGKQISSEGLIGEGCLIGADPEIRGECAAVLYPDRTLTIVDSIYTTTYNYETEQWIDSTARLRVNSAKYKINSLGQLDTVFYNSQTMKISEGL
jgi:hypothetical protein